MGADEPRWVTYEEVLAANAEQIGRFGGLAGIRDENLIHSALARPQNSFHYDGEEDVVTLAVQLGVGIARNHGFLDGNKRTGFVALVLFLRLNGYRLHAPDDLALGKALEDVLTRHLDEGGFADRVASYVAAE